MAPEPTTLQEAIVYFQDADNCLNYLSVRRWPNGVAVCPTCGSEKVRFQPAMRLWQCSTRHPRFQFSIKVGTIMEDSPIGLDKWLPAMWMIGNDRNGISSWELHRALGITQKTAWFMLHRIRLGMQDKNSGGKLGGEVEVDETFIGGTARNMHKARRKKFQGMQGGAGKPVVIGALERNGRVRAVVASDRKKTTIQPFIRHNVEQGAKLHTDEHQDYWWTPEEYLHNVVNHMIQYVDGNVHTNGIENFWSLLKRGLGGTYISVEPFHLFRYVDEQAFRFNNRKDENGEILKDADRFDQLVLQIVGKRLTYSQLTGKEAPLATENF
jgi:transposase-like protein